MQNCLELRFWAKVVVLSWFCFLTHIQHWRIHQPSTITGLDQWTVYWWINTKKCTFYALYNETHSPTYTWSCVESCSLLCSYTVVLETNNLLGLHAVFVKAYPACDGFPVPFVIDFSERGLQSGKLFNCHYTILVYYSYTVMLKCILVSNSFNTQWLFLSFYKPSLVYTANLCQYKLMTVFRFIS